MNEPFSYAEPQITDLNDDCLFYHCMELPGVGVVGEHWDLREIVDDYLGCCDFEGKRVLDVGAGSGFLTFEMERRGADVVSFDAAHGAQWNVVPHGCDETQLAQFVLERNLDLQRLKNAYWYAHRLLNSRAKAYYGDVYNLPSMLGKFDVVFFGMILGHLRDPFQALFSGAKLCRDTIIVTNQMPRHESAIASFMPSRENGLLDGWWAMTAACVAQMLEVLGFDAVNRSQCLANCKINGRPTTEICTTIVARRDAASGYGTEGVPLRAAA